MKKVVALFYKKWSWDEFQSKKFKSFLKSIALDIIFLCL